MKRRLPTTRKGEPVLAAISLPPLTDDANRHAPSRKPSRQARGRGERRADRGQREPARLSGRADRLPAQLDRQRREHRRPAPPARARNRRTQPRAVVYGTPARAAAGRTPHAPPATCPITAPTVSATSSRQASTNAGSSAWLTRHGPHRTLGTKIFRQRRAGLPPGHAASSQTRTPAARRTTGRPGGGPPPSGQPPHTHRPAAGTAIRWPRATHRLRIPPRDRRQTRRGGIPHVQHRQQNPGPHSGDQEATSSKSTARHAAEMLRKSSRQHQRRVANLVGRRPGRRGTHARGCPSGPLRSAWPAGGGRRGGSVWASRVCRPGTVAEGGLSSGGRPCKAFGATRIPGLGPGSAA